MTFLAGAIVGAGVGFLAATLLSRRGAGLDRGMTVATLIASIALVVAAIALARSDDNGNDAPASTAVSSTTTADATSTTSTASTGSTLRVNVVVPNVVGLSQTAAVEALTRAGLKPTIDTLALSNVPAGFVISQNPLAASAVTAATTVTLVVSAAG